MGRERLKDSQGGGQNYAKLEVNLRIGLKGTEQGTVFEYWDKAKEERIRFNRSITGILIGAVNTISSFDPNYGRNGGEYHSSYFMSNKDRIVIWDPSGDKDFSGTREEIDTWALAQRIPAFKFKKNLIILTEQGAILDVSTNAVLFIEQVKKYDKDTFMDNMMVLSPDTFNPELNDIGITKSALERLGKFAIKNNPNYARMSIGEPITDELWEAWNVDSVVDMFLAWKKSLERGVEETTNEPSGPRSTYSLPAQYTPVPTPTPQHTDPTQQNADMTFRGRPKTRQDFVNESKANERISPEDDLPF